MSKNHKNPFISFFSPDSSIQDNKQKKNDNLPKTQKFISGSNQVEYTYQMLNMAVEQSIDGIAVADMKGFIKFCNRNWAKMHGYHIYELLDKHLSIFHTQEQLEKVVIPFNEQVKKTGAYHGEVGHVRKNGKTFSTWMATTLLKDEKGTPIGFLGIARNITKQKRVQEILAASERKYRSLFENSIEGIGISKGNRVIVANKALLNIFGYDSVEEFTKVPLLYHVALESRDCIRERMKQRQKGEPIASRFGYKIIRKDGEIRDLEASSSGIVIDKEKLVLTTFRDITEQKKAQLQIEAYLKEWQVAFNSTRNPLMLLDNMFTILRANEACVQFIGRPLDLVIGKKCYEAFHGTDKPPADCLLQKVMITKKHEDKEIFLSGKDIWAQVTVDPILDEENNLIGAVHVIRDITEIKKTAERVSKINDCFVGFGPDPDKNINSLVNLCGEVMAATCALYNRLNNDLLCSIGQWNVPLGYNPLDKPDGHICYDVIRQGGSEFFIIRNLAQSSYAKTDPNVLKYKLQTYIGLPINFQNNTTGSLCVVYQKDFSPSEEDKRFMRIIASAIAVEENRRLICEEVEKSRKRYKTLTENINVGIYRVSGGFSEGKFIEVNPAMIKMFGYSDKEEFLSAKFADLYTDSVVIKEAIRKILEDGFLKDEELLLKKKDGITFAASASAVAVKDEKGRVKYLDGIIEDVTQRKAMESALRNSELQYRLTIDSMADAIHVVDKDLRITLINKAFKQWGKRLGLEEEIVGKTIFEAFPFLPERVRDEYDRVFQSGEIFVTEEKSRIADKEIITETRKIPVLREKKVAQVMTIIRDITERKEAEEVSRGKEHFFNSVFESLQDGISISDKDMRIIRVNGAMEKWYAHALPLVGRKCYEAYHGRDKRCEICPTIKTLQTGKPAYEVVPWVDKDRKIKGWFDLYSFPLIDTQTNQITGAIEYVRNITQRKLAEEKSEKLNEELLKSNKRLRHLVLRDSHTGLYNHRYLNEAIEAEFSRAERYAQPLSVIMLDLDYFKSINDVYSHQFGDLVLKQFGRKLKRIVRKYDSVIRFGGEEFVVVCPGIDKNTTLILAQRIQDKINLTNFGDEKHNVKLKSSLAVVSYPEDNIAKGMDLIGLADRILNKAKEDGGDRVYSYSDIREKRAVLGETRQLPNVKFLKVKIDRLNKRANQSLIESVFAFARTIKLKDNYTGEHVENTVRYATEIAKGLSLTKDDIEHVKMASMLHDLGKIGISESVLLKKGKLTRTEFKDIKKHPQIGADILRPIHFLRNIIPLIHYHHERWDGKGYPNGLEKEEIPLGARIVAIADVYQALISDRPYRRAYPQNRAAEMILAGSGTQFDPKIVEVFLRILHS